VSELKRERVHALLISVASLTCALVLLAPASALASKAFLERFHEQSTIASTVPGNGDVNPYGIVVVKRSVGALERGNVLISNFNDKGNEQGTGTTLVQISPQGVVSQFAEIKAGALPEPCPGGVGLTTALDILPDGYVVVGSLPTTNGKAATATEPGCLIVLNPSGEVVRTIHGGPINGPWDMTEVSSGPLVELFVTNVLNGTVAKGEEVTHEGTVVRLTLRAGKNEAPRLLSERVIATGFAERTDAEALVVGPTGVGVGQHGTLYVADTQNSRIAAVPDALDRQESAGDGETVSQGDLLKSPLGLTIAPNGDVLTANGGDGNIVETTPSGKQVASFETNAEKGGLFGLTLAPQLGGVYFVDDKENTLGLLH
jgi:hypothetical protein